MNKTIHKKRRSWLDTSRVLVMLLVCYIHFPIYGSWDYALQAFYGSAVPFFLFWAGYFCSDNIQPKKILKRTLMLLFPFIIWEIVSLLCGYRNNMYTEQQSSICSFWGIGQILTAKLGGSPNMPYIGPLWFVRDLIFLTLLTPIICRFKFIGLCMLILIASFHQISTKIEIETTLSPGCIAVYALGCYLRPLDVLTKLEAISTKKHLISFIIFTLAMIAIAVKNGVLDGDSFISSQWRPHIIGTIMGVLVLSQLGILISRLLPSISITISHFAPSMMLVLILHKPLGQYIEHYLASYINFDTLSASLLFAPTLMLISLLAYHLGMRFLSPAMPFIAYAPLPCFRDKH